MADVQEGEELHMYMCRCMGRSLRLHGEVALGILESKGGRSWSWKYIIQLECAWELGWWHLLSSLKLLVDPVSDFMLTALAMCAHAHIYGHGVVCVVQQ